VVCITSDIGVCFAGQTSGAGAADSTAETLAQWAYHGALAARNRLGGGGPTAAATITVGGRFLGRATASGIKEWRLTHHMARTIALISMAYCYGL